MTYSIDLSATIILQPVCDYVFRQRRDVVTGGGSNAGSEESGDCGGDG